MVRQLRNIHVCMVSSRQKLRFIAKQNNFQTEKVYTFTMTTAQVMILKKRRWGENCEEWHVCDWEEEKMMSVFYFNWENESEKRTCDQRRDIHKVSKTTPALCLHNVTTTNLLLALADACDVMLWIHHPIHRDGSIFFLLHHQTGDWYCNETKQVWHS